MSEILLDVLTQMSPEYPPLSAEDAARIPEALRQLRGGKEPSQVDGEE